MISPSETLETQREEYLKRAKAYDSVAPHTKTQNKSSHAQDLARFLGDNYHYIEKWKNYTEYTVTCYYTEPEILIRVHGHSNEYLYIRFNYWPIRMTQVDAKSFTDMLCVSGDFIEWIPEFLAFKEKYIKKEQEEKITQRQQRKEQIEKFEKVLEQKEKLWLA